tara:strand:+ start:955 stop:1239 length:285 start_codon:yes stop_codon:yes gene_type:complete
VKTINKLNTIKRVLGENVKLGTKILDKKTENIYEIISHDKDACDNLIQVGVYNKYGSDFTIDGEDLENEIYNDDAVGNQALRYNIYSSYGLSSK